MAESLEADVAIRGQLITDIKAAWTGLTSIEEGAPVIPSAKSQLPKAFLLLDNIDNQDLTFTKSQQTLSYRIFYMQAWPTSGTMEALRLSKVNALAAIIGKGARYASHRRGNLKETLYPEGIGTDDGEKVFLVELAMSIYPVVSGVA